ncbi:hypothetical protein F3Y22_tig00110890pilonHSYRG01007 [Hibiscus syriacus]|uniref:Uncharacterized protein n=1 Tax=Hibiscus syriacus TaxID=106335 RepID=A0A6A2ZH72_HIBSY|nr:hypothetical protein F3Y22_tig00110890pilonHSYRG01007 [Hibiscus syriacus]
MDHRADSMATLFNSVTNVVGMSLRNEDTRCSLANSGSTKPEPLSMAIGIRTASWVWQLSLTWIGLVDSDRELLRPGLLEVKQHKVIFHPLTGLCITRKSFGLRLRLADKYGASAKLDIFCRGLNSRWEMILDSKMHLSAKLRDGKSICLDVGSDNTIITNCCKCIRQRVTLRARGSNLWIAQGEAIGGNDLCCNTYLERAATIDQHIVYGQDNNGMLINGAHFSSIV